ncbi:aldo/keto reductase [Streptomyces sp. NPDC057694]|uniref:aldo/keto reductase n=1 Tax=unclassified Streptomyces TaxID=2593676 RepID=UPI0036912890
MKYRYLGTTGIRVSQLCLGTLMFGSWGNNSADESIPVIERALASGINYIDTADSYSRGESEEIVGKALAQTGKRDRVVLATKAHAPMGVDPNSRGNSRRWIHQAVDNSLRRLGTDWIDIYQMHRPDPHTDIDETLGALSDLVQAGKIRYLGSSTFPAHQIVEAQWTAERRHRERFVLEQPPYSLLAREIEADVLPTCHKYGMGTATWSPLAGGWLTGRYRKGHEPEPTKRAGRWGKRYDMTLNANQRKLDAVEQLTQLAEQAGISLIHMALAFVTEHPAVTSAIIGPRTMEQFESQIAAADVTLPSDVLDRIDEIVPPGQTLNSEDGGWSPPELTDSALRRRSR